VQRSPAELLPRGFLRPANFNGAAFADFANFIGATFTAALHLPMRFRGIRQLRQYEDGIHDSFAGTTFEHASKFFGAELHQNTVWRGVKCTYPQNKGEAGRYIDAYACLKLEMDRLKKHEDELDFFAFELQSRRVLLAGGMGAADLALRASLRLRPQLPPAPRRTFCCLGYRALAFWFFDARTYGKPWPQRRECAECLRFRRDFGLTIDTPSLGSN